MSTRRTTGRDGGWIRAIKANRNGVIRLFCFPYAGGSASIFREWPAHLPAEVDVYALQLPGRQDRLREPYLSDLEQLVDAIVEVVHPYLDRPYAFFGHSLGALVSFEVTRQLRIRNRPLPARLFVAAHRAPQMPNPGPATHLFSNDHFITTLHRDGGVPEILMHHKDLLDIMIPLLRAEVGMSETYAYRHEAPLLVPLSAFYGLHDRLVRRAEMEPWSVQTSMDFSLTPVDGGHFFVEQERAALLRALSSDLASIAGRTPPT